MEQDGTRILRVARWRRLMFIGTCGAVVSIVASHAERDAGWEWITAVFTISIGLLYVLFGERYRLTDESIERSRGLRPLRKWKWKSIRLVVAIPEGIFLTDDGGKELAISARWFDGFADLASEVVRRVPSNAFRNDEIRDLVQSQAEGKR